MGTAGCQGLGKLRHLECLSLWLQQRRRWKEFCLLGVNGKENPADLFTKHSKSAGKLDQLIALFNCEIMVGRPAAARNRRKHARSNQTSWTPNASLPLGLPLTTAEQALRCHTFKGVATPCVG